ARPVAVTVAQLRIQWVMPDDVVATSCAEVLALPEVQDAIADAASNGFDFDLPEGSSVPDLEGDYQLTQVVTFDPDGDNEGDETEGPITLDDQRAGGIRRRGFNASTRFFLTGNASTVGFCTVQRTRKASCDQTIARLEALEMTSNGTLDGHFISVAVRRHAFTDPTCGARGDYIFGELTLAAPQVTLARVRGKATLPDGFVPTLLV